MTFFKRISGSLESSLGITSPTNCIHKYSIYNRLPSNFSLNTANKGKYISILGAISTTVEQLLPRNSS